MNNTRWFVLLAAAVAASPSLAADTVTQLKMPTSAAPSIRLDAEALGSRSAPSSQGLRPQAVPGSSDPIELPFGLSYSRDAKSLLVPVDPKNEWGVGLNLDVNSSRAVELAPPSSPLGLQPRRTPGVTLQKRF